MQFTLSNMQHRTGVIIEYIVTHMATTTPARAMNDND